MNRSLLPFFVVAGVLAASALVVVPSLWAAMALPNASSVDVFDPDITVGPYPSFHASTIGDGSLKVWILNRDKDVEFMTILTKPQTEAFQKWLEVESTEPDKCTFGQHMTGKC